LGKNEDGIKTFVRVARKDDTRGIGLKNDAGINTDWDTLFQAASSNVKMKANPEGEVQFQSKAGASANAKKDQLMFNRFTAASDRVLNPDELLDGSVKQKRRREEETKAASSDNDSDSDSDAPVYGTLSSAKDSDDSDSDSDDDAMTKTKINGRLHMYWDRCPGKLKRLRLLDANGGAPAHEPVPQLSPLSSPSSSSDSPSSSASCSSSSAAKPVVPFIINGVQHHDADTKKKVKKDKKDKKRKGQEREEGEEREKEGGGGSGSGEGNERR